MTCRICNGAACTESFHSQREQDEYIEIDGKLVPKPILIESDPQNGGNHEN